MVGSDEYRALLRERLRSPGAWRRSAPPVSRALKGPAGRRRAAAARSVPASQELLADDASTLSATTDNEAGPGRAAPLPWGAGRGAGPGWSGGSTVDPQVGRR
ncbi:hypothetical protein GCM10010493_22720 [Streptomyces lavendulae subsp. grasserius]